MTCILLYELNNLLIIPNFDANQQELVFSHKKMCQ